MTMAKISSLALRTMILMMLHHRPWNVLRRLFKRERKEEEEEEDQKEKEEETVALNNRQLLRLREPG
jgi:hypothetical protein